ncbi:serine hydrolase domain-containing protein [Curtobacterium sp. SP.BCo]|uniref:serine hydrolase domain-containing protein n=1 Tax=Curtobacterium sp. SP.BCo TaxID=3435229 RepID=UPI003F74132B
MRNPRKTSGRWRASIRTSGGWRSVRDARGPYLTGSLVEWGSITKGLVGTTAYLTLDADRPVADFLPQLPDKRITITDLVHHTSGLPRLPSGMGDNPLGDPYRATVGQSLDHAAVVPVAPRGEYVYSNLGYALLGEVLDHVHGDWFEAVREYVLQPASIGTATIDPDPDRRVLPKLMFGKTITPWALTGSPYAAAGGVWSTFEDLCRYAEWGLADDAPAARRVSWQREGATTWINGEVRAAGAVIAEADGVTAVVHALAKPPHAADKIATALIKQELTR